MPTTFQRVLEVVAIVLLGAVVVDFAWTIGGDGAAVFSGVAFLAVLALLLVTGWWKKPVALVGAISIAYHECIRDRRTGICQNCGKLHDAVIQQCPKCGGEVEENPHPDEVLDEGTA